MDNIYIDKHGRPIKIALIGGARTGKDTIAGHLCNILGFKRLAFGDKLKEIMFKTFLDLREEPKPRQEMIDFGQACRDIDPYVWIKHLHDQSLVYERLGHHNLVITDVRQPNEIQYCVDMGYTLVKVVASKETQIERASKSGEQLDVNNYMDATAVGYEGYDHIIVNDGTLEDLYTQVENLISVEQPLEG